MATIPQRKGSQIVSRNGYFSNTRNALPRSEAGSLSFEEFHLSLQANTILRGKQTQEALHNGEARPIVAAQETCTAGFLLLHDSVQLKFFLALKSCFCFRDLA